MAQRFLSCDREQVMLLPPSVLEWLPEGHLARFVLEVVAQLDLEEIYGCYRVDGHGRPAHDPAMMVALLLYNYAVGVRSSRAIERRCVEDVACRVIAANRVPDHATVARFRVRHERELSGLFLQVLGLCRDAGMVRVGTVAVDSTKLEANASLDANRTLEGLRVAAERAFAEAAEIDAREDELYGEQRGDELPAELADPGTRAARIRELLEQARARAESIEAAREEKVERHREYVARTGKRPRGMPPLAGPGAKERRKLADTKYNLTDPDSGVVRHRGMLIQGYNVQSTVGEGQVILATRVTGVSPDSGQLGPAVCAAEQTLQWLEVKQPIGQVLADGGYWDGAQVKRLKSQGKRVLVPPPKRRNRGRGTNPEVFAMQAALASEQAQRSYRRRQQIVEPVFAHIKHHRGITRLLRRGKQAAQAEMDLIATTHNLLKLYRHAPAAA